MDDSMLAPCGRGLRPFPTRQSALRRISVVSARDSNPADPLDRAPLCCLVGTTASGKTSLALDLAQRAGAEILSLDSMQVYRGMDVGTAKPSADELARAPHHLIDLVEPGERYDVQRWLAAARAALTDVLDRGARPLFVGGTGLYLAALLRGLFEGPPIDPVLRKRIEVHGGKIGPQALHGELAAVDPASAGRLHPNDVRRVVRALEVWEQTGRTLDDWQREWRAAEPLPRTRRARLVGLEVPIPELDRRIQARAGEMLDGGWPEEAARLRASGGLGESAVQALGYGEALALSTGELTRAEAVERVTLRTRQFARRQRTWMRKFPITWLGHDAPDRLARALELFGWEG
jgi:tRNA dimethylallyltransferase